MTTRERLRAAGVSFWVPCIICVVAIAATVLSLVQPQWIERVSGASPDEGSGESEWWITAVTVAIAIGSLAVTRWRWRRIQPAA